MMFQISKPKGFIHTYIYIDESSARKYIVEMSKERADLRKMDYIKKKSFRELEKKNLFRNLNAKKSCTMHFTTSFLRKIILLFLVIILYCLISECFY